MSPYRSIGTAGPWVLSLKSFHRKSVAIARLTTTLTYKLKQVDPTIHIVVGQSSFASTRELVS